MHDNTFLARINTGYSHTVIYLCFSFQQSATRANCLSLSVSLSLSRLVVPNKGYSSLDQSPDEKPLVALDTDRYINHISSFTATCQVSRVILVDSLPPPLLSVVFFPSDDDFDVSRYSSSGYSSAEVRSLSPLDTCTLHF